MRQWGENWAYGRSRWMPFGAAGVCSIPSISLSRYGYSERVRCFQRGLDFAPAGLSLLIQRLYIQDELQFASPEKVSRQSAEVKHIECH